MPDQWKALVDAVQNLAFLDYITVMKETGCRPQEIRKVESRHLDRKNQCWVFPIDESKGKREKRIVHLTDQAFEICQRLALKHPEGPLFRNTQGRPWTNYALNCMCQRLDKKLGFRVFPYAIRHTFATDAIIRGVGLQEIAELMGHKDLTMLTRIYQHIKKDHRHLKRALETATGRDSDAA